MKSESVLRFHLERLIEKSNDPDLNPFSQEAFGLRVEIDCIKWVLGEES